MSSPDPKPFTIQINSLEALERLIGGSSELEMDIRNNVVARFAEKHLRPLAESNTAKAVYAKAAEGVRVLQEKAMQSLIGTIKDNGYGKVKTFVPSDEFKQLVQHYIDTDVRILVHTAMSDASAKWSREAIKEQIDNQVTYEIKQRIAAGVREHLNKAIQNIGK